MKRKPDPVELVDIAIPVLAELIAVVFAVAVAVLVTGIMAGRI